MKRNLQLFISRLVATFFVVTTSHAQVNLLKNSDLETQGAWLVNQCDLNGSFDITFGASGFSPSGGSGKSVEFSFTSDGTTTAEAFVYQPVVIKPGHTYKFSSAMIDASTSLTDSWIGICYVTAKPVAGEGIEEIKAAVFGTWQECNGVGFDGLIDTSCASYPTGETTAFPYFHVSDTLENDTIYFGIDVGTWGTTCSIDLYFDNITLVDSAEVGTSVTNLLKSAHSLSLFPNPASNGTINIKYSSGTSVTNYSVFSLTGQEVLKGIFINQTTLDLTNLKQGVYFLKVMNNGKSEIEKLILR